MNVNALVPPPICLDCDPIQLSSRCTAGHFIGSETSLMSASLSGRLGVVMLLLDKGALPTIQNEVRGYFRGCASKPASVLHSDRWVVVHFIVRLLMASQR